MNFLDLFTTYLKSLKDPPSSLTIKNYRADINQFLQWLQKKLGKQFEPKDLNLLIIEQYKKEKSTISARSLDRHLSSLRKFCYFLKLEGHIKASPFEQMTASAEALAKADPWKLKNFKNHLYVYNSSHLTIKNYIIDIRQFLRWAEEVTGAQEAWNIKDQNIFDKINSKLLAEYKERLLSPGSLGEAAFSPATVNRKLSSLRRYFKWAQDQGLIKEYATPSEVINLPQQKAYNPLLIEELATSLKSKNHQKYSGFPPLRMFQKFKKGTYFALDIALIDPILKLENQAKYLIWKIEGKPVFFSLKRKKEVSSNPVASVSSVSKEFYAPLDISTRNFPWHKKLVFHARHTRPKWYKTYHSYPITHYFHFAILVIVMSALGYSYYSAFIQTKGNNALAVATGPRVLSFQGKLTDSSNSPITSDTAIRFAIYNSETSTGSALLWQELNTVSPDSDGIFSAMLGKSSSIPRSLFSDNEALWLGITVGQTSELIPRKQLATVAYAQNADTLHGMPAITDTDAGTNNVILALNSSGNLSIGGSATPTFEATGGEFTVSGNLLSLKTVAGTNSNVRIIPDGTGIIDLQKPLQNTSNYNNIQTASGAVEVDDMLAVLATSSGQSALTINQDSAGPLISASTSGTAKFTVSNSGDVTASGNADFTGNVTGAVIYAGGTDYYINNTTSNLNGLIIDGNLAVSGNVASDLIPSTGAEKDLGSDALEWRNVYAQNYYVNGEQINITGANYWQLNSGVLSPGVISQSINLGATATTSALIHLGATSGENSFFNTGNVGIGTTDPEAALEVNGNIMANLNSGASATNMYFDTSTREIIYQASSIRYKKDIRDLPFEKNAILALSPKSFRYKSSDAKDIGLIAEEVQKIIPSMVTYNQEGQVESVKYAQLPIYLLALVKDQETRISNLENADLNSIGDIKIVDQTPSEISFAVSHYYTVNDALGNPVKKAGGFSQITVANLKSGGIFAEQIVAKSLVVSTGTIIVGGSSLRDYIKNTIEDLGYRTYDPQKIASPIAEIDHVKTNIISPLARNGNVTVELDGENSKFEIRKDASSSAVVEIDNEGNATFSGQLSASGIQSNDASISGTLRAGKIIADQIEGLDSSPSAQYITNNYYIASQSAASNPLTETNQQIASSIATEAATIQQSNNLAMDQFIDLSAISGQLAFASDSASLDTAIRLGTLSILQGLMVFGPSSFDDISAAGQISVGGNLILADSSINVLGTDLQIQPLRQGGISFLSGLVIIDTNGNLKIEGNATVSGTLYAKIISPIPNEDLVAKLDSDSPNSSFLIRNSSDSAVLTVNQKGDVTASGAATFAKLNLNLAQPALAISKTEIIATGSAGVATISAHQKELTIINELVTENSLIYITPKKDTGNLVLYLLRQVPKDTLKGVEGSFTVGINSPLNLDIPFNWILVN